MRNVRIFMLLCAFLSYFQLLDGKKYTNSTLFEGKHGWTLFTRFSREDICQYYFTCKKCPHISHGLKIDVYFNQDISIAYFNPKYNGRERKVYTNYISLYHEYKVLEDDCSFITDTSIKFKKIPQDCSDVIENVFINNELFIGKPIESPNHTKVPINNKHCSLVVTSPSYDVLKPRSNITIQYFSQNEIQGIAMTLLFQDNLSQVRSPDFSISRRFKNQWTIKDFGYFLDAKKTLEINLEILSEDLIRHPIPLSIYLGDEIVCGDFTPVDFCNVALKKFNPYFEKIEQKHSKEEVRQTCDNNNNNNNSCNRMNTIMLAVIILLNLFLAIYLIIATYLIVRRKHHMEHMENMLTKIVNNMNASSSENRNRTSNFLPEDYITCKDYEQSPVKEFTYKIT